MTNPDTNTISVRLKYLFTVDAANINNKRVKKDNKNEVTIFFECINDNKGGITNV